MLPGFSPTVKIEIVYPLVHPEHRKESLPICVKANLKNNISKHFMI